MWVDVELFESLNVGLIAHSDRIKLELDYREIMKHFSSEKTFFHNANWTNEVPIVCISI